MLGAFGAGEVLGFFGKVFCHTEPVSPPKDDRAQGESGEQ